MFPLQFELFIPFEHYGIRMFLKSFSKCLFKDKIGALVFFGIGLFVCSKAGLHKHINSFSRNGAGPNQIPQHQLSCKIGVSGLSVCFSQCFSSFPSANMNPRLVVDSNSALSECLFTVLRGPSSQEVKNGWTDGWMRNFKVGSRSFMLRGLGSWLGCNRLHGVTWVTSACIPESRGAKLKLLVSEDGGCWKPAAHEDCLWIVYLPFFQTAAKPEWMTWRKEMSREGSQTEHGADFLGY